jgi:subtilisin
MRTVLRNCFAPALLAFPALLGITLGIIGYPGGVQLAAQSPPPSTVPAVPQASIPAPPPTDVIPAAPEAPPRYSLPPDELKPSLVMRATEAGPDWGVKFLNCPEAWKKTKGKGVVVCVGDTGCDTNHPDLKNRIKAAKDFSGSPFGATDKQGHGTHCAGSILADGDLPGVAPEAQLLVAKVLGDTGSGGVDDIANGIKWAVEQGADVISLSLGGGGADTFIPPALKIADEAGVIVIAAAGNEGPREGTVSYPGKYPQCVAVAACDKNRMIANFSSRGPAVYVTGPGVDIRSTYHGGQYATMSGTSMATPHIAGLAALWVASHPEIPKKDRPAKFREELKQACNHTERNTARGYGVPDAVKLVTIGGVTPPPVTPDPGKPFSLSITFSDLSPIKQADLRAAGVTTLQLNIGGVNAQPPAPMPPPPPVVDPPAPVPSCPGGVCPTYSQPTQSRPLFQPFGGFFRR